MNGKTEHIKSHYQKTYGPSGTGTSSGYTHSKYCSGWHSDRCRSAGLWLSEAQRLSVKRAGGRSEWGQDHNRGVAGTREVSTRPNDKCLQPVRFLSAKFWLRLFPADAAGGGYIKQPGTPRAAGAGSNDG